MSERTRHLRLADGTGFAVTCNRFGAVELTHISARRVRLRTCAMRPAKAAELGRLLLHAAEAAPVVAARAEVP